MSIGQELLKSILADPFADGPRLAYADWLDESGESQHTEYAEFIRLQCRIAEIQATCSCGSCVRKRGGGQHTNGPCAVDQERHELPGGRSQQANLRQRARELLSNNAAWDETIACTNASEWTWSRGFIDTVSCTLADWFGAPCCTSPVRPGWQRDCELCHGTGRANARGPAIVAAQPITVVRLTDAIAARDYGSGDERPAVYRRELPTEFWDILCPDWHPDDAFVEYGSREKATAEVSSAALTWARRKTGLPALKFPTADFNGVGTR